MRNRRREKVYRENPFPLVDPQVIEIIEAKARKLASGFWSMGFEDLVQDGCLTVMEVLKERPDATIKYLIGSVNKHFIDKLKEAIEYRDAYVPTDGLLDSEAPDDLSIEDRTDRSLNKYGDLDKDERLIVELVKLYGLNKAELKEALGETSSIYRKLSKWKDVENKEREVENETKKS